MVGLRQETYTWRPISQGWLQWKWWAALKGLPYVWDGAEELYVLRRPHARREIHWRGWIICVFSKQFFVLLFSPNRHALHLSPSSNSEQSSHLTCLLPREFKAWCQIGHVCSRDRLTLERNGLSIASWECNLLKPLYLDLSMSDRI